MRASVRQPFLDLTKQWEGAYINWMFPDVKGLVSTGFGLLLDPVGLALSLPWRRPDGSIAQRDEVVADWAIAKNFPNGAMLGHRALERATHLRLSNDDLDDAVASKMRLNEAIIRQGWPDYDTWPADAQIAIHSMAWACGPGIWSPNAGRNHWPKLTAALRARDFRLASVECFMNEERRNPGIRPRNLGNRVMFLNAAYVEERALDPDELIWPSSVSDQEDTQPELVPVMRQDPLESRTVTPFEIVHPKVVLGRAGLDGDDDE